MKCYANKIMNLQGYLSGSQMASAFNMLHAKDLIWSRFVQDYLLGTRYPLHDMMAWNADATRLPYSVHSEYLEHLYLNNEFPKGELELDGVKLSLAEIDIPIFLVSTEKLVNQVKDLKAEVEEIESNQVDMYASELQLDEALAGADIIIAKELQKIKETKCNIRIV